MKDLPQLQENQCCAKIAQASSFYIETYLFLNSISFELLEVALGIIVNVDIQKSSNSYPIKEIEKYLKNKKRGKSMRIETMKPHHMRARSQQKLVGSSCLSHSGTICRKPPKEKGSLSYFYNISFCSEIQANQYI